MASRPAPLTIDEVALTTCDLLLKVHNLEPMLHVCRPDRDELILLKGLPSSADGRERALAELGHRTALAGPVLAVFLLMEAWAVELPPGTDTRGPLPHPRHHPDRRDILVVYGWYPDRRPVERRQFTVRKDGDRVVGIDPELTASDYHEQHN